MYYSAVIRFVHGVAGVSALLILSSYVAGGEVFIATDGNDSNDGSFNAPFASFTRAIDAVGSGDTIWVRGGTYQLNDRIRIQKSGSSGSPISMWAYPNEQPILDFSVNPSSSERGIQLEGNWWHLQGLTVQHAPDNGVWTDGSDNIFDQLVTRMNGDSGLQLHTGAARNLILNTDSFLNFDPQNNGENADGFAAKFGVGPGNVFRSSRAWNNSDDGWDLWEAGQAVVIEQSWAFHNGLDLWGVGAAFDGDGNGFKLGQGTGAHHLQRVLAWENARRGIDVNGNTTGATVFNSTVWNSGTNFQFDENNLAHVLRNNVSFDGSLNIDDVDHTFNSWNHAVNLADSADFLSLDPTIAESAESADGSLPVSDFLRLSAASDLVDAGTDVGLPYSGAAPDLGAYETTPVSCDFDGDADCDLQDLNALLAAGPIAGGVAVIPGQNDQFDLNSDHIIDLLDRDLWLADGATVNGLSSPYRLADANLDGLVDVSDFNAWNVGKFSITTDWNEGDFTGDGTVDVSDFNIWNAHKFTSSEGVLAVPEPGCLWWVAMLAMSAVRYVTGRRPMRSVDP